MATNSNSITLVGNLTRDPELRYTTGGRGVANFGLAVNRRYQVNGEWQEQTSFFNIVAWAELGENAAATLTKGSRTIVFGRLEQREYEDRNGEKRSAFEVVADDLGPSLRWAQAQIERNERSSTDGGFGGSGGGGGGSAGGGGGGGGGGSGGSGSASSRQPDPVYGDEEPF